MTFDRDICELDSSPVTDTSSVTSAMRSRAQGCLMGQIAGDSLGSLVEFMDSDTIRRRYPGGVRLLADGGTYNTLAGQPTDDSEMALLLARKLVEIRRYCARQMGKQYRYWLSTGPFDVGRTIAGALRGVPNAESQANGALMRVSPLGIFGAGRARADVMKWARKDAALTHGHPICAQANALYAALIAHAVKEGGTGAELYETLLGWMKRMKLEVPLRQAVERAADQSPRDYMTHLGWVLVAFQNALWQMLYAPGFEEGVVDTVMRGGDTDTNAAIAGALLGAMYGIDAVPAQWQESVLSCRPAEGRACNPRPEIFWPTDALNLANALLDVGFEKK